MPGPKKETSVDIGVITVCPAERRRCLLLGGGGGGVLHTLISTSPPRGCRDASPLRSLPRRLPAVPAPPAPRPAAPCRAGPRRSRGRRRCACRTDTLPAHHPSPRFAPRYPAPWEGGCAGRGGPGDGGQDGEGGSGTPLPPPPPPATGPPRPRPEVLCRTAGPAQHRLSGGSAPLRRSARQRLEPARGASAGRLLGAFERSSASPPAPRSRPQNLTLQTENKMVRHRGARPGRKSG